jgi:3-hydroxyacyl-CoA dehydrogenase
VTQAVAVAGAGLTGASWAGLFAAHGLTVRLYDENADALARAQLRAALAARFLVHEGLAEDEACETGVAALTAHTDAAEAFAGAAHVQECVTENLEAKRGVFALADRLTPPGALIATSSSGLSIGDIQQAAELPGRTLAAHPYNPPHLVPLVELAPGPLTAPETLTRAAAFYAGLGKSPVVVARDVPGYIANRLSAALWREAIELVRSGVASVADVDRAVCDGPGLRWAVMGPHLLYHLGGGASGIRGHLRHLSGVKEGMLRDLATWTEFPDDVADLLADGVDEEVGDLTLERLCAARDAALAAVLRARRDA